MRRKTLFTLVAGSTLSIGTIAVLLVASRPNYCWSWERNCEVDWAGWIQLIGVFAALFGTFVGVWAPIWNARRQEHQLRGQTLESAADAANQVVSGLFVLLENIRSQKSIPAEWVAMMDQPDISLREFVHLNHVLTAEEQKWIRLLRMNVHGGRIAATHAAQDLDQEARVLLEKNLNGVLEAAAERYEGLRAAAERHAETRPTKAW